jgi:hypothetical protein
LVGIGICSNEYLSAPIFCIVDCINIQFFQFSYKLDLVKLYTYWDNSGFSNFALIRYQANQHNQKSDLYLNVFQTVPQLLANNISQSCNIKSLASSSVSDNLSSSFRLSQSISVILTYLGRSLLYSIQLLFAQYCNFQSIMYFNLTFGCPIIAFVIKHDYFKFLKII